MKKLSGIFLKGLAAVLPIAITLYLLYWIGGSAESVLGGLLKRVMPEQWYVPGMGVVAGLSLIFLLGVLLNAYLVQTLWSWAEGLLNKIPFVKTIYGATQDLMVFFANDQEQALGRVVSVPLGDTGYRVLGFVTREDLSQLPDGLNAKDSIAVYTPMSYQIGGYTLIVPRHAVTPVDMTVEEALRFALTAGVSSGRPGKAARTGSGKGAAGVL